MDSLIEMAFEKRRRIVAEIERLDNFLDVGRELQPPLSATSASDMLPDQGGE